MYVHHIYVWCPGRPQESIRTLAVIGFWASNPDALTAASPEPALNWSFCVSCHPYHSDSYLGATHFQTVLLIQGTKHGHTGLEEAILTLGHDRVY